MAKSRSRSRSTSRSPRSRSRRSKSSRSRSRSHTRASKSSRHHRSARRRSSSRTPPAQIKSPPSKNAFDSGGLSSGGVLEACWKPVRQDSTNFDAWTHLLQCVENLDDIKSAQEAFDPFLAKFPYCFGYWRKYADFFKKHDKMDTTLEVYERGVSAIPLSVDLWLGYLNFFKEYVKGFENETAQIAQLYDRALEAAGLEFRSDKLWEDYVNWRLSLEDYAGAMKIYDKMIRIPLLLYSAHFDKLQELVNTYEPHEILSDEEFDKLYKEIEEKLIEKGQDVFVAEENNEAEGEDEPKKTEITVRKKYNDEALKMFRVAVLDKRRKIHLKTENEVSKRWSFEEAIKRPYFHVKPLERAQLKNWRHYLDFEIEKGDKKRIVVLFERCLVACALYEDIWLRYARYAESVDADDARDIFRRACEIHLPHKASMHLTWAAFEEKQKKYEHALHILAKYDSDHPGSVIVLLRRTGIEIRRALDQVKNGDQEGAPDFTSVCKEFERLIADAKSPKIGAFFAVKYARFHQKIRQDFKMAEKIIVDAINRDATNPHMYMQLVQMAYEQQPFDLALVLGALDRALNSSDLGDADKLQFSQRKLELMEDFSSDVEQIQRHYDSHIKLYKNLGYTTTKKRPATANDSGNDGDKRLNASAGGMSSAAGSLQPTTATPYAVPSGGMPPAAAAAAGGNTLLDFYYSQQQAAAMAAAPAMMPHTYAVPGQQTYGYYVSAAAGPGMHR